MNWGKKSERHRGENASHRESLRGRGSQERALRVASSKEEGGEWGVGGHERL